MSKEAIRKYFDIGPAAIATTNVYTGGATGWTAGIADLGAGTPVLPATLWVTGLSQSDDDQGRVGQSINVETLDIRVQITPDTTVAGYNRLRMIVFADEECDGAYPGFSEVLGPTAVGNATGIVMSFLNPSWFGRFKIIEDKNWYWTTPTGGTSPGIVYNFESLLHERHHDLKGHRVMWDTTNNSAIANARKGHIFILFAYNLQTVATGGIISQVTTNPPGIQLTTRIRYRDT